MNMEQKNGRYGRIKEQLSTLFSKTTDPFARMTTLTAVLHNKFDYYFWTGFYRLVDGELTVTCYQGSVACLVLKKHTGVCWAAVDRNEPVIVADVHAQNQKS
jgi:GAF domain-containing protein